MLTLLLTLALTLSPPHHYVFYGMDRDALIADTAFLNNPIFDGAQVSYSWRQLETAQDEYDFSLIRADLALLEAHHKRLFVQLQDVSFSHDIMPVPRYLLNDARFNGGVDRQIGGWITRRWDPAVQERLHKLYDALGKAFDGIVEGINTAETAADYDKPAEYPAGFTPERYRDGIIANLIALKHAFPKSAVIVYGNFMPGEWRPSDDKGYLTSVYDAALAHHVGVGGPDVLPHRPGEVKTSYPLIHDVAGKVPVGIAVQDGNYDQSSLPELLEYAGGYLHADYIFWCTEQPFYGRLAAFLQSAAQH